MAIVRHDRRDSAIQGVTELREGIQGLMKQADAMQASLEDLEQVLGLASEGEQAKRDQYIVMHYPEGEDVGHTLDECPERGCVDKDTEEVLGDLGGEEKAAE